MLSVMRIVIIVTLALLGGSSCAQLGLDGHGSGEIPFEYSAEDFGKVEIQNVPQNYLDDPGFPVDAPAHRCFNLEAKRPLPALEKGGRYFHPTYSVVCIVPTADWGVISFASSYPNFARSVELIKKMIKEKPSDFHQFQDLFDFPYNNAGWSIKAKVEHLDFESVQGVFFLTQYSQDVLPTPLNNEELTANFQGLTKDGKYYVAARFSTIHPSLPRGIDFVDQSYDKCLEYESSAIHKCVGDYLKKESARLEKLRQEEFQPSLHSIKTLLASISVK